MEDEKITAREILENVKPPIKGRSLKGKYIRVLLKTSKIVISESQVFEFGMMTKLAFSFVQDKIFLIPGYIVDGIPVYELKKYGKTSYIIQNKWLVESIVESLPTPPVETSEIMLDATPYAVTGENLKIYRLEIKKDEE